MKENATLIIDQTACAVNHPNGLDADNIGGAFRKNDKSRFYEIKKQDDGKLSISSEAHPTRDVNEKVTGHIINKRTEKTWEKSAAKVDNLYAVIRKRAEHLATKKEGGLFVYHIIFTMAIDEYNEKYRNAAKFTSHQLQNSYIILNYFIPDNVEITEATHGNAKNNPTIFRPTQHSLKKELTEGLSSTNETPRIVLDSYDENQTIFEETAFVRNKKQIYSFICNNVNAEANKDPLLDIIKEIISPYLSIKTKPMLRKC